MTFWRFSKNSRFQVGLRPSSKTHKFQLQTSDPLSASKSICQSRKISKKLKRFRLIVRFRPSPNAHKIHLQTSDPSTTISRSFGQNWKTFKNIKDYDRRTDLDLLLRQFQGPFVKIEKFTKKQNKSNKFTKKNQKISIEGRI